jgi:hypothetical protein
MLRQLAMGRRCNDFFQRLKIVLMLSGGVHGSIWALA